MSALTAARRGAGRAAADLNGAVSAIAHTIVQRAVRSCLKRIVSLDIGLPSSANELSLARAIQLYCGAKKLGASSALDYA
jgi:hypothetical protein